MLKIQKTNLTFLALLLSFFSFSVEASLSGFYSEERLDNKETIKSLNELHQEIKEMRSKIPSNILGSKCEQIKGPFQKAMKKNCIRLSYETKVNELRLKKIESLLLSNRSDLIMENIKIKKALYTIENILAVKKIVKCSVDSQLSLEDHFVDNINFKIIGLGSDEKEARKELSENKYFSGNPKNQFCDESTYTKLSKVKCHVLS